MPTEGALPSRRLIGIWGVLSSDLVMYTPSMLLNCLHADDIQVEFV